jgi:hypothetical protein
VLIKKKTHKQGDLNIEEFLGKRTNPNDEFESLIELQNKSNQRKFDDSAIQKVEVDSSKKIYRSAYPRWINQ